MIGPDLMDGMRYVECDVPEGLTLRQWRHTRRCVAPGPRWRKAGLRRILRPHRA
jgi:hypothetical protein